jgi:hypothetical protein
MAAVRKRLARELRECMLDPSPYFRVWPRDETFLVWEGIIHNLPDARHTGKEYSLTITCSENYPFRAPTVRFNTRVKCENILRNGYVCMDLLYTDWSPAITMCKLMLCIVSLLTDTPVTGLDNKEVHVFLQEIRLKRIEEYHKKQANILGAEPRTANEFLASVEEIEKLDRESGEMRNLMQDYCLDRRSNSIPQNVIVPQAQVQPQQKRKRRTELEMLSL